MSIHRLAWVTLLVFSAARCGNGTPLSGTGTGGTVGGGPSGMAGMMGSGGNNMFTPVPTTFSFFPLVISANGTVVVGLDNQDQSRAMRWTAAAGVTFLGLFYPRVISADGMTIAGESTDAQGRSQVVRMTGATLTPIPFPRATDTNSQVVAMSSDGAVVVGYAWSELPVFISSQGFRWTAADGVQGLDFLPGDDASQALGMSPDGAIIVGVSYNRAQRKSRPFRWTKASGAVELPVFATSSLTVPIAVNDAGTTIGEAFGGGQVDLSNVTGATSRDAIVWTQGAPRVLGGCGTLQSTSAAIANNGAGTILGACAQSHLFLVSPDGQTRTLMLPPDPTGNGQGVTALGLSGDGTVALGRRDFVNFNGGPVSYIAVWSGGESLPLLLPQQWNTASGAEVWNTGATAMSDDGSTITGYASDTTGWVLRLR